MYSLYTPRPKTRMSKEARRAADLSTLPLPYKGEKRTANANRHTWRGLPDALIPLLREDFTLSDNTMRLMMQADPDHADYDEGNWSEDVYDSENNTSLVLLSMCIREDLKQTLGELALRVMYVKGVPYLEAARHVVALYKERKLGFFTTSAIGEFVFHFWEPSLYCRNLPDGKASSELILQLLSDQEREAEERLQRSTPAGKRFG